MKSFFKIESITCERFPWVAFMECMYCGGTMLVERGDVGAVYRIANEALGVVCLDCLDAGTRQRIAEFKRGRESRSDRPSARRLVADDGGQR